MSSCLNPIWQGPSCFFLSRQGLWACHGSNIIASITRREDCWSWRLVNRRLQLNRCFTKKKYIVITCQPSEYLLYLYCHCLHATCWPLSDFVSFPAGPYAADTEILHPPEDRVHRQALLLWRGNYREVSATKSEKLWDEATRKPCGINRFRWRGEQVAYKDRVWGLNGL